MRKGTRGHLLPIVCAFWCAGLLHSDARTQQTFVVRYKNGEHTVPVTVVLDFKKQTEYVINMSPRAATKTVTLYDFKQKTIAYKDLTNRECFLGRLTHETLREETDALTKVQNPVDRQPKILSLDPHRSSLTPTEIRNMAGQKTAVFCGKMNTWLLLSIHNIQKREADDEIDERTFHRHGYHTVRYSHFGRETRRRYSTRRKDTSKIPNSRPGNSENASENSAIPLESPSFQQQFLHPSPLERVHNGNNGFTHHLEPPEINGKNGFTHHIEPPEINGKIGFTHHLEPPEINRNEALHFAPTFEVNPEKTVSFASQPNGLNGQNEYAMRAPFHPTVTETPDYRDETADRPENSGKNLSNLRETKVINTEEKASFVSKNKPAYHSTFDNSETLATKFDGNQQNNRNLNLNLHGDHREGELIPSGNTSQRKLYPNASDAIPENTDVSSNLYKSTKKSQNIDNQLPITQTNEDVHDVFEGFFNLRKSTSPSEQFLYNSYFIPLDPNGGGEHDESLINRYPSFSHTRVINDTDKTQQWRDVSKTSGVITSTDHSSLTTSAYSDYNGATISPTYLNSFPDSGNLKNAPEDSNNLNSAPQKFGHNSRSLNGELLQPISSKEDNTLNKIVDEYFTTESPSDSFTNKRQSVFRSDVTNENKLIETAENLTSSSSDRNLQETNERQNVFHSGIQEGTSLQQIRLQNVLRNYKPDQIVIDVEKIPTQPPPESTLSFQGQVYSRNSNIYPNLSRNGIEPKSEQTSGDTWRGRPFSKTNFQSRKRHNLQQFASRMQPQHRRNESNLFQHRVSNNNIRQLIYPSQQALSHPVYNNHRSYKLDSLPPGVSIHPRHPKAPYADAVNSNVILPAPQRRTPKPHRQRHHKQKECCRGKAKSCCRSCCRGKQLHNCCSPAKRPKQVLVPAYPPKQVLVSTSPTMQVLVPTSPPQSGEDQRNRCQKEKMCRTLYESTQQVMVCRNAKIDGC